MIELLILDVDGCLTDGRITYTDNGDELKSFDVKDGFAIVGWHALGKRSAIITGRSSRIVERRAAELGIEHLFQGVRDKAAVARELADELGVSMQHVAAIGDDLNDYRLLREAGLSFAPADCEERILEVVDVHLSRPGGRGAVREMIEYILEREGLLGRYLERWRS